MTVEQAVWGHDDRFPVGMRVLAVDDDPTCLRLLETLLRRCQYNVTTTNQAITALHLLRDNKKEFDLVISDVHMPDMDGFKLLELVGLEMDLPVIMLSANGDTKLVMKGITHGACDYLLKPVRIEELKNIWQHVVRRKKINVKDHNNYDVQDQPHFGNGGIAEAGNADQSGKLNKKCTDNEDVCEEHDENENDNEDPSTQKKPRVVWTAELHGKFVAAVRQLGFDKAVPKKILELMNVEKLTRENVASHLQKYRLYLKRISSVSNQQAHMVASLGGADSSYFPMGSLNGFGNCHSLTVSNQLAGGGFRPFSSNGMLGRLNTPARLGLRSLPSSGMTHVTNLENATGTNNEQSKFQPVVIPEDHKGGILQGVPMSLELDELQPNKDVTHIGGLPPVADGAGISPISGSFAGTRITGCSGNPELSVPNYPMLLQGHVQEGKGGKLYGDQFSAPGALNKELLSHLPDLHRCSNNWSSAVQSSELQPNTFPSSDYCLRQASAPPNNLRDCLSVITIQNGGSSAGFSSIPLVPNVLDSKSDLNCQVLPRSCNTSGHVMTDSPQEWDAPYHTNLMHDSINFSITGAMTPLDWDMEQSNMIFSRNMDLDSITQSNFVDPLLMKCNEVESSAMEMPISAKRGDAGGQQKPQGSHVLNTIGSSEDLASTMIKQEQVKFPERNFGACAYSVRTGI